MRRTYLLMLFLVAACQPTDSTIHGNPFTEDARRAAATIDADYIRATVAEISSDAYEGRGPGSLGDAKARTYLAHGLAELGLSPGGEDEQWEQPFDLIGIDANQPETWIFSSGNDRLELTQHQDFIVGSGVQAEQSVIEDAELVFVGFGIEAPEYEWDDFKGADLAGKVLVMLNNDPDWDPELFAGNRRLYYGRWTYKYESAARQGAAGAIIIHTTPSAGYPWQVVQTSWTGPQFELPAGNERRVQVVGWVTEEKAAALATLGGHDLDDLREMAKRRDFEPVSLGLRTSIRFDSELTEARSANVLGLLKGGDPELADQVVIYTAHHDHLGVGLPNPNGDPDDIIYNGARDNASGTGAVLAIARAFAALETRPRRSILIAFVGAEEQGLLGAKYYARHPSVAPGKIAANVNYDSMNIWGPTSDVTYVGLGKSSLDQVAYTVAEHQGRTVKPDQFPDRGYFYRSDQFALARIGVPALYVRGGTDFRDRPPGWGETRITRYTTVNYHQPSDELSDDWNFDGMIEDAKYGFWAGLIVANADDLPVWNPGDEFEAARRQALLAVQ